MQPATDLEERGRLAHGHYWALALWASLAGVIVVPLFLVLHSLLGHVLAIVVAASAGVVVSAYGYGWSTGDPSRFRAAVAGALGGGIGLGALHLIPLLH